MSKTHDITKPAERAGRASGWFKPISDVATHRAASDALYQQLLNLVGGRQEGAR